VLLADRSVQLRGSALARALLRLAGWRVQFDGLPGAQGVLVVYPHTSNWDFVVGLLAKWAMGVPVAWWGKDSLFRVALFGRWLRWLGGVPVPRTPPTPQPPCHAAAGQPARPASGGAVPAMVEAMRRARAQGRFLWLALAPEGTRRLAAGWRSGFYRVALGAEVPVGLVRLDYASKRVGLDSFWRLSGDAQADLAQFARSLADSRGLHPHLAAPVRLLEP
jgi:1-acyl-sn-glycerol-3-phosphate acyltransferase